MKHPIGVSSQIANIDAGNFLDGAFVLPSRLKVVLSYLQIQGVTWNRVRQAQLLVPETLARRASIST